MIYLSDLERWMVENKVPHLTIQQVDGSFQVNVRMRPSEGFTCAQQHHPTLSQALREHVPEPPPMELLV